MLQSKGYTREFKCNFIKTIEAFRPETLGPKEGQRDSKLSRAIGKISPDLQQKIAQYQRQSSKLSNHGMQQESIYSIDDCTSIDEFSTNEHALHQVPLSGGCPSKPNCLSVYQSLRIHNPNNNKKKNSVAQSNYKSTPVLIQRGSISQAAEVKNNSFEQMQSTQIATTSQLQHRDGNAAATIVQGWSSACSPGSRISQEFSSFDVRRASDLVPNINGIQQPQLRVSTPTDNTNIEDEDPINDAPQFSVDENTLDISYNTSTQPAVASSSTTNNPLSKISTRVQQINHTDEESEVPRANSPEQHKLYLRQTVQALHYASNLGPVPDEILEYKRIELPEDLGRFKELSQGVVKRRTLIFDLDETLIHCVDDITAQNPEFIIPLYIEDQWIDAGVNVRPHAVEVLQWAQNHYEVGIFTASDRSYADPIIDFLDPNGKLIHFRLYREHCIEMEDGNFIKDLRIIQNRDLDNVIIVDNSVSSFGYQLENGIPILPFFYDQKDEEMIHLMNYLQVLTSCENAQEQNLKAFELDKLALFQLEDIDGVYNDSNQELLRDSENIGMTIGNAEPYEFNTDEGINGQLDNNNDYNENLFCEPEQDDVLSYEHITEVNEEEEEDNSHLDIKPAFSPIDEQQVMSSQPSPLEIHRSS